ncbi:MAG: aconitate hydratase AcnA [Thermoproteaceae archaeon]|nr:aconitate hydratase AcnA [Thermoproteaceae archaeon]
MTEHLVGKLSVGNSVYRYYRIAALGEEGHDIDKLPYSLRVLLENVLRNLDGRSVTREHLETLLRWDSRAPQGEVAIRVSRVIMQDYTGVPVLVDLATLRDAVARAGGNPLVVNPQAPVDLVIDHSVSVDFWGSRDALRRNVALEIRRNKERYRFIKWAQQAFANLRVFPPGAGIIHQVNLELLARVVVAEGGLAYFETVIGTDSHTTMTNGLGVVGWGVGGIEAEAALLGEPVTIRLPRVVAVCLYGEPRPGVTATDVALTLTELLRKAGVVDAFIEFVCDGVRKLTVPDRAVVSNMAPEYGATVALFPVDEETLRYLAITGRPESHIALVRKYYEAQGLFGGAAGAEYSRVIDFDLSAVERCVAGPTLPWDRRKLAEVPGSFMKLLCERKRRRSKKSVEIEIDGRGIVLSDGDVVIAAVASCTNTSNPYLLVAVGLLARRAAELGVRPPPYVKTSFTPGSRAAAEILERSGLQKYLDALGFHVAAYGCATCIGNSGPLPEPVIRAVREHDILVAAVISGNRNFEGRIHPDIRAVYLASPPLVVAYAIAGTVTRDLESEPLAYAPDGRPVYLRDLWPAREEVRATVEEWARPEVYREAYTRPVPEEWHALETPSGALYSWRPDDTYIQPSPLAEGGAAAGDIVGARPLLVLGDNITTDHISPAGEIPADSPAGRFLISAGVSPSELGTFGSRRGNWQVMVRGTFCSRGYVNKIGGLPGGLTIKFPEGIAMTVYEAAEAYKREGVPLVIVAGKNYGVGSSRDWAAKGPRLLGVRAVIAESFERIHRQNLIMVGIAPVRLPEGITADRLGLDGSEVIDILGLSGEFWPEKEVLIRIRRRNGRVDEIKAKLAVYTRAETEYLKHGGVYNYILSRIMQ